MNKIDLTGHSWGSLNEAAKEHFLKIANPVDEMGNNTKNHGCCIIDFDGLVFSISGSLYNDEIKIDDDAVFYNPSL
jgi:hypothetical protein